MEKNVLLTIAYDGTGFHGWQRQPDRLTVQGHLEKTLSRLFRREIILNGTSRTDAGVHALRQQASFRSDIGIPTERLARVINNALCGSEKGPFAIAPVRILAAEEMPLDFHARFDAKGKTYIYKIRDGGEVDLFSRNYAYHVEHALDRQAMKEAAGLLTGTHDFKSFEASGGNPRQTTVRTILDLQILESAGGGGMELHVTGDGFLYNMVRILTGTLVEVGLGKRLPEEMTGILNGKDRSLAGHTAPPYGLYLAKVYY